MVFLTGLSESEIAEVIGGWTWHPPGSQVFENSRFRLSLWRHVESRNVVDFFNTDEPDRTISEVESIVQANGRHTVTWQCKPNCFPVDMARHLSNAGYVQEDRMHYLHFDMGEGEAPLLPGLRTCPGAETAIVTTVEDEICALRIGEAAFNRDRAADTEMRRRAEDSFIDLQRTGDISMIAWTEGRAACSGGATVEGKVLKLWGAGTHPDFRQRGLYGTIVLARCMEGFRRGARYAVVTARETTSMPTLLKGGFLRAGTELHFGRELSAARER